MNLPPLPPENGAPILHKAAKAGLLAVALAIGVLAIFVFNFSTRYRRAHAPRAASQEAESLVNDGRSVPATNFDFKTGTTNASLEKLQEVRERTKNFSQSWSGADAIMANALSADAARSQIAITNYQIATAKLREAKVLGRFDPADKGQFAARRAIVQQFLDANTALKQVAMDSEDRMRLDMAKAHVSSSEINRLMAGYHKDTAAMSALTLQARQCDERIGAAMLHALDTLETNWGKWKPNPDTGQILFEDTATRDAYNSDIHAIQAAAQEQQKLRGKIVNQ